MEKKKENSEESLWNSFPLLSYSWDIKSSHSLYQLQETSKFHWIVH